MHFFDKLITLTYYFQKRQFYDNTALTIYENVFLKIFEKKKYHYCTTFIFSKIFVKGISSCELSFTFVNVSIITRLFTFDKIDI